LFLFSFLEQQNLVVVEAVGSVGNGASTAHGCRGAIGAVVQASVGNLCVEATRLLARCFSHGLSTDAALSTAVRALGWVWQTVGHGSKGWEP
jgi:hypothetical protein